MGISRRRSACSCCASTQGVSGMTCQLTHVCAGCRSAAVTCAVLGPAGPQRSRILANLYRDDRTTTALPPFTTTILRKMFLDHILRPGEVAQFAAGLAEHQLARLPVDHRIKVDDEDLDADGSLKGRKGPENVLDKAVMEHNIQACAKVGVWASRGRANALTGERGPGLRRRQL